MKYQHSNITFSIFLLVISCARYYSMNHTYYLVSIIIYFINILIYIISIILYKKQKSIFIIILECVNLLNNTGKLIYLYCIIYGYFNNIDKFIFELLTVFLVSVFHSAAFTGLSGYALYKNGNTKGGCVVMAVSLLISAAYVVVVMVKCICGYINGSYFLRYLVHVLDFFVVGFVLFWYSFKYAFFQSLVLMVYLITVGLEQPRYFTGEQMVENQNSCLFY